MALFLVGCGHPATNQECEEIFRHSAEIELQAQNVTDKGEIERRVAEARAAKGDALMKDCVGKRITESALQCVRDADSGEQIDACLK
jgi:hypothetical protein